MAILAHKPNLDALNSYRTFSAIYAAIQSQNPSKVKLLLNAGVNIYKPCGLLTITPAFFQPNPEFRFSQPLSIALSRYLEESTGESEAIVKHLLFHGAAINFDFSIYSAETCSLLDEDFLVIGAKFPEGYASKAITDIDKFIARVPKIKYPHTLKVVTQALEWFHGEQVPILSRLVAHIKVVEQVKQLIADNLKYKPFIDAIDQQNYSLALRRACACKNHSHANLMSDALFMYKNILSLESNAASPSNQKTAYDYAKEVGNQSLCDKLSQYNERKNIPTHIGASF